MSKKRTAKATYYYFIDVDLRSRQIVAWDVEEKAEVEVHLTEGFHRAFLTKGQYNKLARKLAEFSSETPKQR